MPHCIGSRREQRSTADVIMVWVQKGCTFDTAARTLYLDLIYRLEVSQALTGQVAAFVDRSLIFSAETDSVRIHCST